MSSFDATSGTRGGRQPGGFVMSWFNKRMAKKIKSGKGATAMGLNPLMLITIGAKSGQVRETPVGRFAGPDGTWYVVASANGATNNPAWRQICAEQPRFAKYSEKTDRVIPIIQLTPRAA